ncbi:MAG: hypothetical protein KF842_06915 [Caulobacter sp.]|nr:hypothetical protein [Caulobacter sp.]
MDGFGKGFFGCFGVLAAVALVAFGVVAVATFNAEVKRKAVIDGTAALNDYADFCPMAFNIASRAAPIRGAMESGDVLDFAWQGANPEIICDGDLGRGSRVLVTVKVMCGDPLERFCLSLRRVSVNGDPVWAPPGS